MHKDVRVSITANTVVAALCIIAGAYALWFLRDLVLLVLTSIVIASAIEPWIAFLIRRRIPRFFAALLVYASVFGAILAVLYFLLPPIIGDVAGFLSTLPQYLETLNIPAPLADITGVADLIGGHGDLQSLVQALSSFQSVFSATSGGVVQLVVAFFGSIFASFLVIVLSFYFALQDTGVDDFLHLVMPVAYEDYSIDLWRRAQKKIGLWMQGQILLSVIVGILVYLGLLVLGVPYALLLSVLTAMAEIIPIFGSLITGAMAVSVGLSSGGLAFAAIVLGLYVVVNQFESNLIYPLIVKKVVGVPPLLVIVALIAGYTLVGFLGLLLSVPVAAVGLEFISDFDKRKRRTP